MDWIGKSSDPLFSVSSQPDDSLEFHMRGENSPRASRLSACLASRCTEKVCTGLAFQEYIFLTPLLEYICFTMLC